MKRSNSAIYHPISMKFETLTDKNMLSLKNAKPEVSRHFRRWPTPPSLKSTQRSTSAIIHPILMKIGTQTRKNMLSPKSAKAEVSRHFPKWPTPPS
jgi:hypothetical protein